MLVICSGSTGNAKIGNAFEIKREDIRPVALEVAFEDFKS